jgi:ribose transport system ATP-binding protein
MEQLRIKSSNVRQPVGQLSGGNQQKVVLAKMLARGPKVLLMDEPTRGIDVGTKVEIYRLIRSLAESGTTVVFVSSEIPELIGLSDRVLVMNQGHIVGEIDAAEADDELILTYAYGRTA